MQHNIPVKLLEIEQTVYLPCDLEVSNVILEPESKEYSACQLTIHHKKALFRVAKITPTKTGQFVTFWKRSLLGPIAPFDFEDNIDFFIVTVLTHDRCGQFVFPKGTLLHHDIISKDNVGGKRAMRVYPPWDKANNAQAIKTQRWQLPYFFEISSHLDKEKIKKLFS